VLSPINKDNFNQTLNRFSTSELETLVEKFPYFQQAHLLLAKKYQQQNDPRFDQQLQLAALYTQDRELLYSIFNEKVMASPAKVEQLIQKEIRPEIQPETQSVIQQKEPEIPASDNEPVVTEEATPKKEEELIQLVKVVPPEPEIPVSDNQPVLKEETQEPEVIEAQAEERNQTVQTPEPVEEKTEEITVEEEKELLLSDSEPVISAAPAIDTTEEKFLITDPHTFDEWLQAFAQTDVPKLELNQEEIPAEPDKQDAELEKLYMANIPVNLQELVEEETHYSKGLDKFIEEQIQKHKAPAVKMSSYENELAPELITETMAKVYEMQKKYSRAIRCYEILALKYPEKNDFFAARINYLKSII
jgi:hypothetical protein